jgi:hypothetical protein
MTVTPSIRAQILARIADILEPVNPGGVYRSREAALAREEGPGVFVRPADEAPESKGLGMTIRDFTVVVGFIVRGRVPDDDADPLVVAAQAAIMADPTLGGLVARTIEDATTWDFEQADMNAVAIEARYKVRYATPANTLARTF